MALKVQASFAAGELDPALHERTTLEKYKSALATARNVIIGKTGRILTRPGREHFVRAKHQNRKIVVYGIPDTPYIVEWGHEYARLYNVETYGMIGEVAHTWTEDDLDSIHFDSTVEFYGVDVNLVYAFCDGKAPIALGTDGTDLQINVGSTLFQIPTNPTNLTLTAASGSSTPTGTAPNGYDVDYVVTAIINGQESMATGGLSGKLPNGSNQWNVISADLGVNNVANVISEMRVYRRPKQGGAYGYIGSSTTFTSSGGLPPQTVGKFFDYGQAADYTNSYPTPNPTMVALGLSNAADLLPATGLFYQKRLLMAAGQRIEASRTAHINNFWRDYPLATDSSLSFKAGTSGSARVLRMIDSDGLVVFTTAGIFLNVGALGPTNIALDKRGNWVIDPRVPPIAVPGGVLFIDSKTNVVRSLSYSQEKGSYTGDELSVFSDHLFTGNQVVSWAFHDGDTPCLFAVFADGTFASFTYEPNHEMRAWTRHDSARRVEYVASTGVAGKTVFVTEENGYRYLELTVPRYVSASKLADDPDAHMGSEIAFMDSIFTRVTLLNDTLSGSDVFTFTPVTPGDWEGELDMSCGTSGLFSAMWGTVGTIFRIFDEDGAAVDLEVISKANDNQVRVQPSALFPSSMATTAQVYDTITTVTGLNHINGKYPVVIVDGYVICSPNNDVDDYPSVQVSSNSLTLPNGLRGAIIHVGLPIVADAETLDIDTVEQRPTLIESKTVDKVYVKTHKTRGVFVGNKFPKNDKVNGMVSLDSISVDYTEENEVIANRYEAPTGKRHEVGLPGDWASQGRVCLRQVDPVHFEILSIIPDLEDLRR